MILETGRSTSMRDRITAGTHEENSKISTMEDLDIEFNFDNIRAIINKSIYHK